MIKIVISYKELKEIKEKHWKWFNKHLGAKEKEIKNKYKELDSEKSNFDNIIFGKKRRAKEIGIEDFKKIKDRILFVDFKEISKLVKKNKEYDISYEYFNERITKELKKNKKLIEKCFKERSKQNDNKELIKKLNDEITEIYNKTEMFLDKIRKENNFNYNKKSYELFIKNKKEENEKFFDFRSSILGKSKTEELINIIFNYDKFANKTETVLNEEKKVSWGRHSLLKELGVDVCPYCNRQYITSYQEKNKDRVTADLDHFYIKSKYPYLALSIYNFIPSCQICNSRFKGDKDFAEDVIYPYEEEFGNNGKFTIRLSNEGIKIDEKIKDGKEYDSDVFFGNSDNFLIDFNIENDDDNKIEMSIEKFKLREVYQFHKYYVRELIKKAIIYNDSQIDELYREYEGTLFSSREDVVSMIVSNYVDKNDLGKRVLAKLTLDISEELGLIQK